MEADSGQININNCIDLAKPKTGAHFSFFLLLELIYFFK